MRDIQHPALAILVRAEIPPQVNSLSTDVFPYLESKILESERLGIKIKALLLPNPHNPLPQVAPKQVIMGYALLAQKVCLSADGRGDIDISFLSKYNIHLIVDEVYGLSTFQSAYPPSLNAKFESVLTYDLPAMGVDPSRVHVLAGPTKDFGASGLKCSCFAQFFCMVLNCILRCSGSPHLPREP